MLSLDATDENLLLATAYVVRNSIAYSSNGLSSQRVEVDKAASTSCLSYASAPFLVCTGLRRRMRRRPCPGTLTLTSTYHCPRYLVAVIVFLSTGVRCSFALEPLLQSLGIESQTPIGLAARNLVVRRPVINRGPRHSQ